ncbi:hypothetical protein AB3M83_09255 [Microbacterium sp. 179-B 1A2 NHS]
MTRAGQITYAAAAVLTIGLIALAAPASTGSGTSPSDEKDTRVT